MSLPRLLAVMGSGETSPTMVATHRELFRRLGADPHPVPLETPYAFQENAAQISARAVAYFGGRVGRRVEVLRQLGGGGLDAETALARLRAARWVFAGPGSPSYALAAWRDGQVPQALVELLRRGGCVVFASAAACTIGSHTLPVYEIYKVGQAPFWLDGLDLVAAAGLRVAVVPHYDNSGCLLGGTLVWPYIPDSDGRSVAKCRRHHLSSAAALAASVSSRNRRCRSAWKRTST